VGNAGPVVRRRQQRRGPVQARRDVAFASAFPTTTQALITKQACEGEKGTDRAGDR